MLVALATAFVSSLPVPVVYGNIQVVALLLGDCRMCECLGNPG